MVYSNEAAPLDTQVLWDFRQVYVEWINFHIKDYITVWRRRDYSAMLEKIRDWHASIWGRTLDKKFIETQEDTYFTNLIREIITLSNEYENTFLMKEKNPLAVEKLNERFRVAVSYLVFLMKKHKMFGYERINRSL